MTTDDKQNVDEDLHLRVDHLKDDLGSRSAKSGVLTLTSQFIKFCISSVSTIILARLLTPADYGIVGMVAIVLNFAVMFQYLGLSTATVQWPSLAHKQVSTLFWINVSLSLLIAGLMAAISPVIALFFGEPRVIGVTLGYSLSVLITGLWIQHEALLNRQMRFGRLVLIDNVSLASGLFVSIVAAWKGAGYWALVVNQLVTTSVQCVGYWSVCKWRPGLPARGTGVRPMLSFGSHFTGTNLLNFFSRNTDNILIGKFWGPDQLGLYSRAYQLLLMPLQQVLSPISSVALPTLSRLEDSPDTYRRTYLGIIEKLAMVLMPGVALMCAISDWLVVFLLGKQWEDTGKIFMFLGIAAMAQPVTRSCYWLFATQQRTHEMFRWSFVAAAISVLSIVGGLYWGAKGVAAFYALTDFFVHTPLLLWYVGRKGPVRTRDFYKTLFPSLSAAIFTLVLVWFLRPLLATLNPVIIRLVVAGLVCAFISIVVYGVLPSGREAIKGFVRLFQLVTNRAKSKAAA